MQYITLICGYGPGISDAVARRFGMAGHRLVLVARNAQRLASAVDRLSADGIQAQALVADLSDPRATKRMIHQVRTRWGPIGMLHWNAFFDVEGSLLSMPISDLSKSLSVRLIGYLTAVQQSFADLKAHQGCVLATSGITALHQAQIDAFTRNHAALAIAAAAQHKATAILADSLANDGIYVGELIINGLVCGTPAANATSQCLDPAQIAEEFWQLQLTRQVHRRILGQLFPMSKEWSDG